MRIRAGLSSYGGLFIAILFAVVICFISYIAYKPKPQDSTEAPVTSTLTNTPTNIAVTANAALTITPMPMIADISVSEWTVQYNCKNNIPVDIVIFGAVISGGSPPYSMEAIYKDGAGNQQKQTAETKILVTPPPSQSVPSLYAYRIGIAPPIIVNPNGLITIIIRSGTPDGEPRWQSDLFFLSESSVCN